jgi:hypothetical protein
MIRFYSEVKQISGSLLNRSKTASHCTSVTVGLLPTHTHTHTLTHTPEMPETPQDVV